MSKWPPKHRVEVFGYKLLKLHFRTNLLFVTFSIIQTQYIKRNMQLRFIIADLGQPKMSLMLFGAQWST